MKLNKPLATAIQRYEMCSIALKSFSKLELVDFEILSSSPSYTFDTINFLNQKSCVPKIDTIVVGMDSFKEINLWKKGNELKRNYNFLVIKRSNINFDISKFDNVILFDDISDLSSTTIRKKIFLNKAIVNDTPIEIVKYITDNNLYKNGLPIFGYYNNNIWYDDLENTKSEFHKNYPKYLHVKQESENTTSEFNKNYPKYLHVKQ